MNLPTLTPFEQQVLTYWRTYLPQRVQTLEQSGTLLETIQRRIQEFQSLKQQRIQAGYDSTEAHLEAAKETLYPDPESEP